jgi:hypothetical protein
MREVSSHSDLRYIMDEAATVLLGL